jgi:phosphomannomutase
VHTALHGVATDTLLALFARAGLPAPHLVAAQSRPDPDFPTVGSPNPEEPGTLDLAIAEAIRTGAEAAIANDPDGDRLAVAIPEDGAWRTLTGDELGVLLAEQALATTSGPRLVVSTIVSSTLLGGLAADAGATWATTLSGSKWIVRAGAAHPGMPFAFGYEEALGYLVHDLVRDKDGITAAAAFAALVARLRADGTTVAARLEAIARRHGLHATRHWSVRLPGADGERRIAQAIEHLTGAPPRELAGRSVLAVERPAPDVIVLALEREARVVVRPSGTEPKLKAYLQVVIDVAGEWARARAEASAELDALAAAVIDALGLGD